jgi:hypothetical protein
LLGRYRLRARFELGQRLARRLRVREVLQQLAELLRSQALQFGCPPLGVAVMSRL